MKQPLRFPLGELVNRDAGPGSHDRGDIVVGYLVIHHALTGVFGLLGLLNLRFDAGNHFVVELGGFLVVTFPHRSVELNAGIIQFGLQFAHIL